MSKLSATFISLLSALVISAGVAVAIGVALKPNWFYSSSEDKTALNINISQPSTKTVVIARNVEDLYK